MIFPAIFNQSTVSRSESCFDGNTAIITLPEKNFALNANRANTINLKSALSAIEKELSQNLVPIYLESDKLENYPQHNPNFNYPFPCYKYSLSEYTADS